MRQRADADQVGAHFLNCADGIEVHAVAYLRLNFRSGQVGMLRRHRIYAYFEPLFAPPLEFCIC